VHGRRADPSGGTGQIRPTQLSSRVICRHPVWLCNASSVMRPGLPSSNSTMAWIWHRPQASGDCLLSGDPPCAGARRLTARSRSRRHQHRVSDRFGCRTSCTKSLGCEGGCDPNSVTRKLALWRESSRPWWSCPIGRESSSSRSHAPPAARPSISSQASTRRVVLSRRGRSRMVHSTTHRPDVPGRGSTSMSPASPMSSSSSSTRAAPAEARERDADLVLRPPVAIRSRQCVDLRASPDRRASHLGQSQHRLRQSRRQAALDRGLRGVGKCFPPEVAHDLRNRTK
jgi:hypothetical protein